MNDPTAGARKAAERVRKRAAGLVPVEVWVHASNRERLKKAAAKLEKPAN